ncbi:TonB-dependent receptor domain-containing protein [Xenorhabdus taiwanensis]|uniref:TonB receptor-related protein n=1 Tax=Xenorhabdus taiwanensis TaxID=3085177 RepID=A0ABN7BZI1_9GAMM|nr:hypothetical protein TCT1_05970 [Xenorhabdus sp. TCT-1]
MNKPQFFITFFAVSPLYSFAAYESTTEHSSDTIYVYSSLDLKKNNEILLDSQELNKQIIINPADIFKSTSGVLSGESRSSGAIDVNIRGLQGQGRISTSVDDTINQTALYRGYQGVSNRTYIDPDFIGEVGIKKGFYGGSGITGIGGTVNMKTISPADILIPGDNFGIRLKGSILSNHSNYNNYTWNDESSPKKENIFNGKNNTGSVVVAYADENFELLAGVSKRIRGNYHSGKKGFGTNNYTLPGYLCPDEYYDDNDNIAPCPVTAETIQDAGYTIYPKGAAVPNTSENTRSYLLKTSAWINDEHRVSAIYSLYDSTFGETYVADTTTIDKGTTVSVSQGPNAYVRLARYKLGYDWKSSNPLIDLNFSLWHLDLKDRPKTSQNTLGDEKKSDTWGVNLSNNLEFDMYNKPTNVLLGGSYLTEKTGPAKGFWSQHPHQREGTRQEYRIFVNGKYELTNKINLLSSLEHKGYSLKDKGDIPSIPKDGTAYGYSFGVEYRPIKQIMLYSRYSQSPRFPSLVEGTNGFFMKADNNLQHETMKNIEIGSAFGFENLIANDELNLSIGYFNSNINNYISRSWKWDKFSMHIDNINKAKFEGIELETSYKIKDFTIKASANYYINIEFCKKEKGCVNENLPSDYATNHIPPKKSYSLDVNQGFLNNKLSIGGRISYFDKRAIPTARVGRGSAPLLAPVDYKPATIVDFRSSLIINKNIIADFTVDNVFDRYYIQPINVGYIPSPGRTFRLGITATF